jgi:hypothetical protein
LSLVICGRGCSSLHKEYCRKQLKAVPDPCVVQYSTVLDTIEAIV